MTRKDYIANLNAMNHMDEEARRAHIVNQVFAPMFATMFAPDKAKDQLPEGCDGCRVDAAGTLICCVSQENEE